MLPIEQDMRDIVLFDPRGTDVLSLFLDTDPSRGAGRNLEAQVNDALRDLHSTLTGDDLARAADIEESAAAATEAIRELQPIPRAAAAYVSLRAGFLRVVPLPEPVRPSAHWGPRLHVRPLLAALDEHEKTVVALVDQEHGRVFRVFMGQIEEVANLEHRAPGRAQAGRAQRKSKTGGQGALASMGYGERNLQRRREWHVHMHLERILDAMHLNGDRLFLGGGKESVHELIRLLPKRVRGRAVVIDGLDIHASTSAVLERVVEIQRAVEREEEAEMLRVLAELDPGRSAFGAAAVAEAASDARVHTLVYAAATEMSGAECKECGWLMPGRPAASCPRCGAVVIEAPEFIERLVSQVIWSGGRIEEVRGPAQAKLLETEGLAALLRYAPSREAPKEGVGNAASTRTSPSHSEQVTYRPRTLS